MPTTLPLGSTSVNLSEAPGGEISLDDLFPVEPENMGAQPSGTPPQQPEATPPPQPEFFLTGNKSRYKSAEEAVRGIDTKDTLIDRYRSFLQTQGVDPDTLQTKAAPQTAAPSSPSVQKSYLEDGDRLFDDLASAATKGDKRAYVDTLGRYQEEYFQQRIGAVVPLLAEVARQRAVRQVSAEAPDFAEFLGGNSYTETVEKLPRLKAAIAAAENNLELADSLPELYQIAYLANQGRRKPDPVQQVSMPATPPTPPARPTTQPSTMTPPPQATVNPNANWANNHAVRKQLISDMENRGMQDIKF